MEKLKLIFVDYGLGKFYHYRIGERKWPVIQINIKIFYKDKELFFWILQHELDHYVHYQDPKEEGKKDLNNEIKHAFPNKHNIKMLKELFKFEIGNINNCYKKDFAIYKNKQILNEKNTIHYVGIESLSKASENEILRFIGTIQDL